jgi:hypothetical protein
LRNRVPPEYAYFYEDVVSWCNAGRGLKGRHVPWSIHCI